mmetsp:Transcript_27025/g.62433  ORF Transcript_27025/g.62433 Transcript_27025/m.62433 type:complete len:308 (+) Transcript_27025:90-1013(+)
MRAAKEEKHIHRDLTSTYKKFRNDRWSLRSRSKSPFASDGQRLLGNDDRLGLETEQSIEMSSQIPPQWLDSAEEAREDLRTLKEKLVQLTKIQQKRLLKVFEDDGKPDKEVDAISNQISDLIRHCERCMVNVKKQGASAQSKEERDFRDNVQKNIATHLQQLSQQYRQAQKDYLAEIRKRQRGGWDDGPAAGGKGGVDLGFNEAQLFELETMEVNAQQRSEEICHVAASINDLNTVFKELAVLVIDQGSILDRIDYNIEQVVDQSKEANVQLQKAEKSQKSNRATKCMLFLVVINVVLILVLIMKKK